MRIFAKKTWDQLYWKTWRPSFDPSQDLNAGRSLGRNYIFSFKIGKITKFGVG